MGDAAAGEPSTSSVIRDGAVSGVLPESQAFAIHYPGYPTSIACAMETLGGLAVIAKVRNSETANLELRFRPGDPYCHPAHGELRTSTSLLLRIRKSTGAEQSSRGGASEGEQVAETLGENSLSAEVVARVNHAYKFEGMADYQHVLGVHAAEERRKKRPWASIEEPERENEKDGAVDMDGADVMMLVPPLFSMKDRPEKIVLIPPGNLFSKNIQKGFIEHKWELNIEPCIAIPFDIERIPGKFNWEDCIAKNTIEWESQVAVMKLFDEKPIWPRWSLHQRLWEGGHQVSVVQLKRLLFRAGYYFSTGPFGHFWIRKGYDPRSDPESRIFQKVDFRMPHQLRNINDANTSAKLKQTPKELCHFEVWPSKIFVCLQLFELDDAYIQQLIRKPVMQKTCTRATGWFSSFILRIMRVHVSLRFLSLYPGDAEVLIMHTQDLLDRLKKDEPLRRQQKYISEGGQHVNEDTNGSAEAMSTLANEHIQVDQDGTDNCDIEDEDEEEELDGYESPTLACEDGYSFGGDGVGEGFGNDYLEGLLRSFPFSKGSTDGQTDDARGPDNSDGEYQIFEQASDDDENW